MAFKQKLLFYKLLKYSGTGTVLEASIDQALDRLGCATAGLAAVPPRIRLANLRIMCKVFFTPYIPREVEQRLIDAEQNLYRNPKNLDLSTLLFERAVEVVAVAFSIQQFTKDYVIDIDTLLSDDACLKQLLMTEGKEVLICIANHIDSFTSRFVQSTLNVHRVFESILVIKTANIGVYKILLTRPDIFRSAFKKQSDLRTKSLTLDDDVICMSNVTTCPSPEAEGSHYVTFIGRRALSLDVTTVNPLPVIVTPDVTT